MKIIPHIITIRPVNVILTSISVWIGYWFADVPGDKYKLLAACLSAGLICAGGNVFNDLFDLETDRIIKPHRPYPSGRISGKELTAAGIIYCLAGIALGWYIGILPFLIAVLTAVLLMIYNIDLKNRHILGNTLIGLLSSLAFIYGAATAGNILPAIVPAVFTFLYHTSREIFKDIEDMQGDKKVGRVTLPIKSGVKTSIKFASAIFIFLIILTPIPYIYLDFSLIYLLVVVVSVDVMLIVIVMLHFPERRIDKIPVTNKILKIGMFAGLIALMLK